MSKIQLDTLESNKSPEKKHRGLDPKILEIIESEIVDKSPSVTYDDIIGLKNTKKAIFETIVWPMFRPDIFQGLKAPPKKLLLFGPPGTGKSMICKAIATEAKAKFFSISTSIFASKWVGEVKNLFAAAKLHSPSIIFIDDVDSLLCCQIEIDNETSRCIKAEFMVQLEGKIGTGDEKILIIGATNRPQELDEAVRSRFTKRFYISLPNREARKELLKKLIASEAAKGSQYNISDPEMDEIAALTKGCSGADMRSLCAEVSKPPVRKGKGIKNVLAKSSRIIDIADLRNAVKKVKAAVSTQDLGIYSEWNRSHGNFDFIADEFDN